MKKGPLKGGLTTVLTAPAGTSEDALFLRVASILEEAQARVVRVVHNEMVLAYWQVGREIVEEHQRGKDRAGYGESLLAGLASRLGGRVGPGYSVSSLKHFRQFYSAYSTRRPEIGYEPRILLPARDSPRSALEDALAGVDAERGFLPSLSWTHYRALMRVPDPAARLFYEMEAARDGWSTPILERQINSHLYFRLLKSRDKADVLGLAKEGLVLTRPVDAMREPVVLDFLAIPEATTLHENELESAIIGKLQEFLLELGKGFAFLARQKRLDYEGRCLYVDLVFYNCILKCYLLIDLKMGELTHGDVGQMDSYVRLYDDLYTHPGDNPTIGLILCTKKNEAIARYSVLNDRQQIFAAQYLTYLPTIEQLQAEIARERALIEAQLGEGAP